MTDLTAELDQIELDNLGQLGSPCQASVVRQSDFATPRIQLLPRISSSILKTLRADSIIMLWEHWEQWGQRRAY